MVTSGRPVGRDDDAGGGGRRLDEVELRKRSGTRRDDLRPAPRGLSDAVQGHVVDDYDAHEQGPFSVSSTASTPIRTACPHFDSPPTFRGSLGLHDGTTHPAGLVTCPMKRMPPLRASRMRKTNGRSRWIVFGSMTASQVLQELTA